MEGGQSSGRSSWKSSTATATASSIQTNETRPEKPCRSDVSRRAALLQAGQGRWIPSSARSCSRSSTQMATGSSANQSVTQRKQPGRQKGEKRARHDRGRAGPRSAAAAMTAAESRLVEAIAVPRRTFGLPRPAADPRSGSRPLAADHSERRAAAAGRRSRGAGRGRASSPSAARAPPPSYQVPEPPSDRVHRRTTS